MSYPAILHPNERAGGAPRQLWVVGVEFGAFGAVVHLCDGSQLVGLRNCAVSIEEGEMEPRVALTTIVHPKGGPT